MCSNEGLTICIYLPLLFCFAHEVEIGLSFRGRDVLIGAPAFPSRVVKLLTQMTTTSDKIPETQFLLVSPLCRIPRR